MAMVATTPQPLPHPLQSRHRLPLYTFYELRVRACLQQGWQSDHVRPQFTSRRHYRGFTAAEELGTTRLSEKLAGKRRSLRAKRR